MLEAEGHGEEARKPAGPMLLHLTINTGLVRRLPRSEVAAEIVSALRPLVDAGGGEIPGAAGYSVQIRREGRDALFNIIRDERPVIVCGLAVDDPEAVWKVLSLPFLAGSSEAAMPTEKPWLAVLAREQSPELYKLADFERCLAWAILEAAPSWPGPPS